MCFQRLRSRACKRGIIFICFQKKKAIKRSEFLARSNRYAKFVSFEFRNNRLSIKTKARQLHKLNISLLLATETVSENKSCHSEGWKKDDVKKGKPETEKENKSIRHVCGTGSLSQWHALLDLMMED